VPVARLALAGAAAASALALALAGCSQPTTANDNRNSQRTDRTITEPTILRTPVKVSEAPATVPLPGPTGGPVGEPPDQNATFSPGPGGETAETSEQGPDGT
jgi:hypothetical protein